MSRFEHEAHTTRPDQGCGASASATFTRDSIPQFTTCQLIYSLRCRQRDGCFVLATSHGLGLEFSRRAVGCAVEPVRQSIRVLDPSGLARQNEEGRLKRVFGVVGRIQHSTANSAHQGTVPSHQRGEGDLGGLIASRGESLRATSHHRPATDPASSKDRQDSTSRPVRASFMGSPLNSDEASMYCLQGRGGGHLLFDQRPVRTISASRTRVGVRQMRRL